MLAPRVYIELCESHSRHSSPVASTKMFSAIFTFMIVKMQITEVCAIICIVSEWFLQEYLVTSYPDYTVCQILLNCFRKRG